MYMYNIRADAGGRVYSKGRVFKQDGGGKLVGVIREFMLVGGEYMYMDGGLRRGRTVVREQVVSERAFGCEVLGPNAARVFLLGCILFGSAKLGWRIMGSVSIC